MEAKKLENDHSTIKSWVEAYSDGMFSWCYYKTNNKETAEDLVQDTFMSALSKIKSFEGKSNPKTWLFRILNNKIADYYRKLYRNPIITESKVQKVDDALFFDRYFDANGSWLKEQRPQSWQNEEEHLLDNQFFIKVLKSCMNKLPTDGNTVIQLKYLEEIKGTLICEELNITPTNLWQILHRARLQLRKCLELHWFKK